MKTTETNHYRQGDVLIEQIADIPNEAIKQEKSTQIILAHGEVTGHHHALETELPVEWHKSSELLAVDKPHPLASEVYVSLPFGGTVVHPEHSAIKLPVGNYRVVRQREYSPEALRNVED
jgi:hypothetical protein